MVKRGILLSFSCALFFGTMVFLVETLANSFSVDLTLSFEKTFTAFLLYFFLSLIVTAVAVPVLAIVKPGCLRTRSFLQNFVFILWVLLGWFTFIHAHAGLDIYLAAFSEFEHVLVAMGMLCCSVGGYLLLDHVLRKRCRDEDDYLAAALSLISTLTVMVTIQLKVLLVFGGSHGTYNPLSPALRLWEIDVILVGIALYFVCSLILKRWMRGKACMNEEVSGSNTSRHARIRSGAWRAAFRIGAGVVLAGIVATSLGIYHTRLKPEEPATIASASKDKPNILLIVVDALRASSLSEYGYERNTFPILQALTANGIFFKKCVTAGSRTVPSIPSILSSLYPSLHGTFEARQEFPDEVLTVAELVKEAGYTTACFSANPLIRAESNYDQGFDYFPHIGSSPNYTLIKSLLSFGVWKYLYHFKLLDGGYFYPKLSKINAYLLPWLKQNKEENFFAYIHAMDPHNPYFPVNRTFSSQFPGKDLVGWWDPREMREFSHHITEEQRQNIIDRYDDEMLFASSELKKILAELREIGISEKTIIILTADHGEEFWEHGHVAHGHTLYNELVMVPLIFAFPESFRYNPRVVEKLVRSVDITPTILDMLDIPTNQEWQFSGLSLLPVIETERPDSYTEQPFEAIIETGPRKAIVRNNIKLIVTEWGGVMHKELYDIENDPAEKSNKYDTNRELAAPLEEALGTYLETARERALNARKMDIGGSMKKQLKALGYLE